jgi:integrase
VEAQVWLRDMQREISHGFDIEGSQTNLTDYMTQWMNASKASLRVSTAYQYELMIRKHIIPNLGKVRLADLRLQRVEQLYSELVQSGLGIRTVRYVHAVLHRALERAVRYGLLLRNPAHGAALPRLQYTEMNVLDAAQVSSFLVAASGSHYDALYHMAVNTGMRQGELFGLKWADLKWTAGTLSIQRQVQRIPGHTKQFVEPKTKAGRRTIKLGEGTLQALRLQKDKLADLEALAGERWQEHDLLFPCRVGTPADPSNLRIDFRNVLKAAGLPVIRFHDLRHTAASLMLNNGVPAIVVSKILGHSKPSVTLDVYGHLYLEMQTEAAKIMDGLTTPIRVEMAKKDHDIPR